MFPRDLRWSHRIPMTLLLVSPFDVIASLGMDFYLPVVPKMPGILGTTHAVIQITLTSAVTANGALGTFDDMAGSAVALYSSLQSLIAGVVGTLTIAVLGDDTGWPLAVDAMAMAILCASAHAILQRRSGSQQAVAEPAR
ncbi:MAG: hypothetical protein WBA46_13695 [Thermomicrobiales bacterium]